MVILNRQANNLLKGIYIMKYYYDKSSESLYHLNEENALCVSHKWEGVFDTSESYEVWEYDKSIGEEQMEDGTRLDEIWARARKALS